MSNISAAKLTGLPEGSYLHLLIEEKMNWYVYHKEQMEIHEKQMKKVEQDLKDEFEAYKAEYDEMKTYLEQHPERKQKIREFGHRMPMVENLI